jgi:hypothetical protein
MVAASNQIQTQYSTPINRMRNLGENKKNFIFSSQLKYLLLCDGNMNNKRTDKICHMSQCMINKLRCLLGRNSISGKTDSMCVCVSGQMTDVL